MKRLVLALLAVVTLVAGTAASAVADLKEGLPLSQFRVALTFDGMPTAYFKSVSGLSIETEVVEYREGGAPGFTRKLIGVTKWPNLVLKQGFTGDPSVFQKWAFRVAGGQSDRRNGVIVLYDDKQQELARYVVTSAWPAKWEGPDFDASKNELAIETIEIAHDGLRLVDP